MKLFLNLILLFSATCVNAQSIVASNAIRARSIITASDVVYLEDANSEAPVFLDEIVGMEARVNLYTGRAISLRDVRPPAIVERNQRVTIIFNSGLLNISIEGRVLSRAGIGEIVRVMNLSSRKIVYGELSADGTVEVRP